MTRAARKQASAAGKGCRRSVSFCLIVLLAVCGCAPAALGQQYARSVSGQINASGKMMTIPVPFSVGDQEQGDIVISVNPDDSVSIAKSTLLSKLGSVLEKDAAARLAAIPDENGNVDLAGLQAAGFTFRFDRSQLTLTYVPNGADRALGDLSLQSAPASTGTLTDPAKFAGFANLTGGLDHVWAGAGNADETTFNLEVQPVLRAGQTVLAGDWTYQSAAEPFVCPTGAICVNDQVGGLKRTYTRAIYDWANSGMRLEVGDTQPMGTQFQNPTDTLGFSLEQSARKLDPATSLSPTGSSSFRLDRPSDVDVMINGAVVRHLHLPAGPYNLSDIPLQGGANNVTLEITDDTGQRRTQAFSTVFDSSLLAKGKSEWGVSGGVPSYMTDSERVYRSDYVTGGSYLRYGLSNTLTGELEAQADTSVFEAGGTLKAGLPIGFMTLGAAASEGHFGTGEAVSATWSLPNAHLLLPKSGERSESISLSTDYRSSGFHEPGEYIATAGNVIYPQYDYSLRFGGFYTMPIKDTMSMSLSGRYSLGASASRAAVQANNYTGNRYGLDASLSAPVSASISGSFTVGYGNDSYLNPTNDAPDVHAGFRLTWREDEHTNVAALYDSLNRDASVSADRESGSGTNRWDTSVQAENSSLTSSGTAGASVGYTGNRFEARVSQVGAYNYDAAGGGGTASALQRTSATFGTAIAFADGHVAIGAPIRGDAFAIVYPHESLAGKTITVGQPDYPLANTDSLGPALVGTIPSYVPMQLPIDVADLPLGYSLGEGQTAIKAPFGAGYAIEVGSSHSVSAYGTLLDANGDPVKLLTGTATRDGEHGKEVAVFTNSAGRFGADGLAPGHWTIEMATDGGPLHFAIDIPAGSNGLFKAGTLRPVGG